MRYPADESSTLEWKKEYPENDQILKTVIGFCNHHGGRIVVGVANSGEIVGISQAEIQKALESLDKAICEASHPAIIPRIYAQLFGDKSILTIEVSTGMSKPYFRKSEGMDRGTYIRIGRNTVRATPDIIEELQWQSRGIDFETLPHYRSSKEDLDLEAFQFFLGHRKNHAHAEANDAILRAYQLLVSEHSKLVPTHAGLLLFGKYPQQFLPEAMIICSHFEGRAGRNTVATVDCEGTLFNQFKQAYAFITSRLYRSFKIEGPQRKEKLEIPEVAIREALLNAIIHRNYHIQGPIKVAIYDNRVEIFSPGLFPGPLDPKNLKTGVTYLRNPFICKVFREAGYVEKLGSGLIAIFDAYAKEGLTDPQILEGDNYVKSILPREQKRHVDEDNALLALFAQSPEISLEDVQRGLGISRATASRRINEWIRDKKVDRIGKTRSTRYRIRDNSM
jgi:ATP-dependent DNA helicase RecG